MNHSRGHKVLPFFAVFAILFSSWAFAEDNDPTKTGLVEIERDNIAVLRENNTSKLNSYYDRRTRWSTSIHVGRSQFNPSEYISTLSTAAGTIETVPFDSLYTHNDPTKFVGNQFSLGVYRNVPLVSFGVKVFYSDFSTEGGKEVNLTGVAEPVDSFLKSQHSGAKISLQFDQLFSEPYIVPYIEMGTYTLKANETFSNETLTQQANSMSGTVLTYGILIMLNIIDESSAEDGYQNYGLKNTFLFIDSSTYTASSETQNFSMSGIFCSGLIVQF